MLAVLVAIGVAEAVGNRIGGRDFMKIHKFSYLKAFTTKSNA
jgi:hypothetical protein